MKKVYSAALKRADPIAKVERAALMFSANNEFSAKSWAEYELIDKQSSRFQTDKNRPSNSESEEYDSDKELGAFMDGFVPANVDPTFTKLVEPLHDKCFLVKQCGSTADLADFLSAPLDRNDKAIVKLVLFKSEQHFELSTAITSELERLFNTEDFKGCSGCSAVINFSVAGKSHPLFRSKWISDMRFPLVPPFVLVFSYSTLEVQYGFTAADLERSLDIIKTWWLTHALVYTQNISKEESDDNIEVGNYCDKPGCSRTFPHEHVKRLNKAFDL